MSLRFYTLTVLRRLLGNPPLSEFKRKLSLLEEKGVVKVQQSGFPSPHSLPHPKIAVIPDWEEVTNFFRKGSLNVNEASQPQPKITTVREGHPYSRISPRERELLDEIARTDSVFIASQNMNIVKGTADVMLTNIRKKFQESVETVNEVYFYRRHRGILGKTLIPSKGLKKL